MAAREARRCIVLVRTCCQLASVSAVSHDGHPGASSEEQGPLWPGDYCILRFRSSNTTFIQTI